MCTVCSGATFGHSDALPRCLQSVVCMGHFPAHRCGPTRPGAFTLSRNRHLSSAPVRSQPVFPHYSSLFLCPNPPLTRKALSSRPLEESPAFAFTPVHTPARPHLFAFPACLLLPPSGPCPSPVSESQPRGKGRGGGSVGGAVCWLCHNLPVGTGRCRLNSLGLSVLIS